MSWSTVRLELARSCEFPHGSVSRAYLVRVPLDDSGSIDEREVRACPALATVRRFWSSEADRSGKLVKCECGWCFCFSQADGQALCRLGGEPMRLGDEITITEPDGSELPFRVASIKRQSRRSLEA